MTMDDLGPRFDAVIVGGTDGGEALDRSVRSAGGRTVARLGWDETSELATILTSAVVVADLTDAGPAAEAALDDLMRHRERAIAPVVAVITSAQIDLASALLGDAAQLLCDPSDVDLVGALVVAGGLTGSISDVAGEGEAARLQRLNDEVARIAEVLSRLTKREGLAAAAHDVRASFDAGISAIAIEPAEVRRTIRARRLRDRQFGRGLFEDPAWDMILDLFAAELEHGQVSVSSLCVAAAVAPTTALRWIGKLTDAGIFRRQPDPFDRRRAFVELSTSASAGMRSYVAAVRAAGLPIA